MPSTLIDCKCGGKPKVMSCRVAEDAEEAWVECQTCGCATEHCEDSYADFETAEWLWQRGLTSIPKRGA